MRRVAFVTNICPHYRVRTFELLARRCDIDFYFFSSGDEWYWMREHGTATGSFRAQRVPGVRIGGTRITPSMPLQLFGGRYDVYIKCINGRFALPATFLTARLARRPFILWTGVWMRLQTPAHRLLSLLTRFLYRHADAIVVYGDHVARFLEGEGVKREQIFIAPHAVDNDAYGRIVPQAEVDALRRSLGIEPTARVVLFIGRLETDKGLSVLVRAFAAIRARDAVLVLAGTGSERTRLEALARQLGVAEQVKFPGYVPPAETVAYYALAWMCVLPSVTTPRFKEPWGLVVNEAFNQGVPVVASDAVGAAAGGLVRDGVTGLVVPENNVSALSAAVQSLIDSSDYRERLSGNARAVIAAWNNERMVSGFTQAIEYVLRSGRR
jgi:glycosyltransferase involved in cell wall biosynthesis